MTWKWKGVYRGDKLIALFPTQLQAEKHAMARDFKEFRSYLELVAERGLGFAPDVREVDITINKEK